MFPNFDNLDWRQFEKLCGALLVAEGCRNVHLFGRAGAPHRGIDWVFDTPDAERGIAQVKHYGQRPIPVSLVRQVALDLRNGLSLCNAQHAFLIVSSQLTGSARAVVPDFITVWDAPKLHSLIAKHGNIARGFAQLIESQSTIDGLFAELLAPQPVRDDQVQSLISRLASVPTGKTGWRQFEDICIDILTYAFVPPLRLPRIQSTTEDGLDRRDAVYPIGFGNSFWESIKHEYGARMVVAEFKNYSDPIGQTEVESLQQYLLPKAKRSFGLLCSRFPPSENALKARRRAWMLAENIILFLSDDELAEIVRAISDDTDPSNVLDAQIDEFFVTLAP